MRYRRRSDRPCGEDEAISDSLAAVNERLDELTRHFERVARVTTVTKQASGSFDHHTPAPDRVAEALARLDRLAQMVGDARTAAAGNDRRDRRAPPPEQPAALTPPPPRPAQDGAALEQQLRQITVQIAALRQPCEDALNALRGDLAEIGRLLREAMPRQAIQALEGEVRALSERVDRSRQAGAADAAGLAGLERGLAEVRDALRALTPAESLVGFEEAVRALIRKIDRIGAPSHDPFAFKQLEQAVVSLRGVAAKVASDGALAELAAEVRQLNSRFEQATAAGSTDAFERLDARIGALMERGRAVPAELEAAIRTLCERLERLPLSQGDQFAIGSLEDRIAKLAEKLDASDARLGQLDGIERGIADLLVEIRSGGARGPRGATGVEAPVATTRREADALAAAAPQAPAAPQTAPQTALPAPAPATPSLAPARSRDRRPAEPPLPPDTPIEPGGGLPRARPHSAAARIAASEAALGSLRPAAAETGGRSAPVAAARLAATSSYVDTPVVVPTSVPRSRGWFSRGSKAPSPQPEPVAAETPPDSTPTAAGKAFRQIKALLIAASVVVIVVGTVQTAVDLLMSGEPSTKPTVEPRADSSPAPAVAPAPARSMAEDPLPVLAPSEPTTTGEIGAPSMFDPPAPSKPPTPSFEITGSLAPQPPQPPPALSMAPLAPSGGVSLSNSIGAGLLAAALAGEAPAAYEIGMRFAEGRGLAPNMHEAVQWFDRAAKAGFVPALFRLASLIEKGDGLKKDLQAARRLYTAAAEKGHAKAMHNLAVLYAEGIDGKPDYRAAALWFRKAARYGIADSQYNLAVLYARGIGVETNLAESYKWFALAAARGDQESAGKRDEVAERLDQQTLVAARLAVQTFTPEREPDEATDLKVPLGGWDRTAAAAKPVKPAKRSPASTAQ